MILALTSDEEGGKANGVDWLVKNHRDLIDAELCVNADGGGGHIKNGRHLFLAVQAAEKVFLTFKLESKNPGGHSSRPSKDNAIYHLAEGLTRLAKFDFPVRLFDVTRASFERIASLYPGQLGADLKAIVQNPNDPAVVGRLSEMPAWNAQLRTTCVATMLSGGHAENALPQTASAVVNCRLLPVDKADEIEKTLTRVIADPKVSVTVMTPAKPVDYKPMSPKVMAAVTAASAKSWPGLPVVPVMTTGASDGIYLIAAGIPTYGVSGMFGDEDDNRNHGKDERILVKSFYDALEFMYSVATEAGEIGPVRILTMESILPLSSVMKVRLFTILAATSLFAADEARLALELKAQTDFERVFLAPAPALHDTNACIQTQASMVADRDARGARRCSISARATARWRRRRSTANPAEFLQAASEFDKATEAWAGAQRRVREEASAGAAALGLPRAGVDLPLQSGQGGRQRDRGGCRGAHVPRERHAGGALRGDLDPRTRVARLVGVGPRRDRCRRARVPREFRLDELGRGQAGVSRSQVHARLRPRTNAPWKRGSRKSRTADAPLLAAALAACGFERRVHRIGRRAVSGRRRRRGASPA